MSSGDDRGRGGCQDSLEATTVLSGLGINKCTLYGLSHFLIQKPWLVLAWGAHVHPKTIVLVSSYCKQPVHPAAVVISRILFDLPFRGTAPPRLLDSELSETWH